MMIDQMIMEARSMGCSDIHITVGMPLMYRINGRLQNAQTNPSDGEIIAMLAELLTDEQRENLERGIDADFAIRTPDGNRQRVNVFKQDGKMAATIRLLNSSIPSMEMLGLPSVLRELADKPRGMILVTGPTGSGKSTTLASMIDYINENRPEHIITIEDPVEYVYDRKMALIHQREVGRDVTNFASALRSALREDPDIILVGEMRDYETISAALTAAETGHLVMSTLHTTGAAQTIDRIIDACPAGMQNQVRTQLASVLNGVITQCLIPNARGNGRVVATEILVGTDAVCNQIRENKCHEASGNILLITGTSLNTGRSTRLPNPPTSHFMSRHITLSHVITIKTPIRIPTPLLLPEFSPFSLLFFAIVFHLFLCTCKLISRHLIGLPFLGRIQLLFKFIELLFFQLLMHFPFLHLACHLLSGKFQFFALLPDHCILLLDHHI